MVSPAIPGGAMLQSELRVCPECGAVAPSERTRCGVCDTTLGPLCPTVPCPLPGRAWARVEVTLPCPHCTTVIPLRPEAVGAPVRCPRCGQTTQVDLAWWDEALHMTHAMVDLSFPDLQGMNAPLGVHNPFAAVGVRESAMQVPSEALPSQTPLRLRASPGAPLCRACRNPISFRVTGPGRVTTQCPRCNDREAFSVPDVVMQRFPSVRALLSFTTDHAEHERVEPWWLLIEGLSYMRPMVQESKANAERAAAQQQAWAQWQQQEQKRQADEARARQEQAERDRAAREEHERLARERAERDRLSYDAQCARAEAEQERAERERLQHELAQFQSYHQTEVERLQREAWERAETDRIAREQSDTAARTRYEQLERDHAEKDRRARNRWRIAIALWAVVFLAVAADLALVFIK